MDIRFSVGEMAKLAGVSRQTLIYYDREGIFQPKAADPKNGYRFYTADQLEELDSLLILRDTGMPLKEIKAYLAQASLASSLQSLRKQRQAVQKEIARLSGVERRLDQKIESLQSLSGHALKEVSFVECPAEFMAVGSVAPPFDLVQGDIALKKLLCLVSQKKLPYFYEIGTIVCRENLEKGDFLSFSQAFVSLERPCKDNSFWEKPAGIYAQAYHQGRYQDTGKTYRRLLREAKEAGYRVAGPSYEYCLFDRLITNTPEAYVTKLQIQVEK